MDATVLKVGNDKVYFTGNGPLAQHDVTIVDNTPLAWSVVSSGDVVENAGSFSFTITRTGDPSLEGSVNFSLSGSAASVASDVEFVVTDGSTDYAYDSGAASYNHASNLGVVNFGVGETSKTIYFSLSDDTVQEATETVTMLLSNPSSGNIPGTSASATVSIADNDTTYYAVTAPITTVVENVGAVTIELTRSGATSTAGSVDFTLLGSALLGSDYSYTSNLGGSVIFNPLAGTGTVSFAANETSVILTLNITDDTSVEIAETIVALLSNANTTTFNSQIVDNEASIVITDNETATYSVAADQLSINEQDGSMSFTITRSGDVSYIGSIEFLLSGTTVAAQDYINMVQIDGVNLPGYSTGNKSGVVNFAVGETSKTITVNFIDDIKVEDIENLRVIIENGTTGIGGDYAFMSNITASTDVVDNDNIFWSISTSEEYPNENAGFITYTISRIGNIDTAATIQFDTTAASAATAGTYTGSWSAGADYERTSQLVSFAAGDDSVDVTVRIRDDVLAEAAETVVGAISAPSLGTVSVGSAVSQIIDNDSMTWSVSGGQTVFENEGRTLFTVTRSGNTAVQGEITISTHFGSAVADEDYIANTQTLTFAAGQR